MNSSKILSVLFAFPLIMVGGCPSSPEICDQACSAWHYCVQVEGNTVNYPYDTCYDECLSDGDWDIFYVQCVESYRTCPEIGNNCG